MKDPVGKAFEFEVEGYVPNDDVLRLAEHLCAAAQGGTR